VFLREGKEDDGGSDSGPCILDKFKGARADTALTMENMSISTGSDLHGKGDFAAWGGWRWGVLRLVHAASASASALQRRQHDGIDRPLGLVTGVIWVKRRVRLSHRPSDSAHRHNAS